MVSIEHFLFFEICQRIITTILKDPMPFHHAILAPCGYSNFHSIPIKTKGEDTKLTLKANIAVSYRLFPR
jgi:hypothetical protein